MKKIAKETYADWKARQTSPVANLVEVIRPAFIERAKQNAQLTINYWKAQFEAANWNADTVLGNQRKYPDQDYNDKSPEAQKAHDTAYTQYKQTKELETFLEQFLGYDYPYQLNVKDAKGVIYREDLKQEAKYLEQVGQAAHTDLNIFIIKLTTKIGICQSATVQWIEDEQEGKSPWFHSVITAKFNDSHTEKWKTKEKMNHSGYSRGGKYFYQWPTILLK